MKRLFAAVMACAVMMTLHAAAPEEEVRECFLSMADKMAALDFDGATALLADEYVEVDAKGKLHTKEEIMTQTLSAGNVLPAIQMIKKGLQENDLEKVLEAYMRLNGKQLPLEASEKIKSLPSEEKQRMLNDLREKLTPLLNQFDAQFAQLEKWRRSLSIHSLEVSGETATVVATQQKMGNPRLLERSRTTLVKRNGKWFFIKTVIFPVATTEIP